MEQSGMDVDEFCESNERILARFCLSLCHNREQADELAQETFTRALSNYALLSTLAPSQRRAWLFTTARNLATDYHRFRVKEELFEVPPMDKPNDEVVASNSDGFDELISGLPALFKEVLVLKFVLGLNSSEISKRLKVPASTVRRRVQLAIKKIEKRGDLL